MILTHLFESLNEQRLNVGDPIVVTGPNEFEGKTGEIAEFSPSGKFVVVDLYNHGKHSMHLSDVEYNQYAADQEDEDDWYDDGAEDTLEGFQDFNKVEPYAVCLAGKPVKRFDYYEQARRFHDNWKQKLYREGDKAKADKITLMPLNLDEATGDNKFDSMLSRIGNDPWTQLNSDPNWEEEIEELVYKHIEPWVSTMERSNMPITKDNETLNPGWRKRYEQISTQLAKQFLKSRKFNPNDPDLVNKIRAYIDWHTNELDSVHGQLDAYATDLPLQRHLDTPAADQQTATIRANMLRDRDPEDREHQANPRRLDPGNLEEDKWEPWTGGNFGDDHDMNHLSAADADAPSAEQFKAMIQYYGNDMLTKRALWDLNRITHGENMSGENMDLKFAATLKNHRNGKTEIKYVRSKKDAYNHAQATGSEVISLKPIESDYSKDLITLPVMLGLGDHKKKWMLQFPDERTAQRWEFQHKNAAQIQWPSGHGLAESAPDQKSWMSQIKSKYPTVKFMQAKTPGAPIRAYVDGKVVAEFKFNPQTRAELANIQPSKGTPVPAKEFARGVLKDLKKVNVKEAEGDFRAVIRKVMSKVHVDGGGGNLSYMISQLAPTMDMLRDVYHDDIERMLAKAHPNELKKAAEELKAMFKKDVAEDQWDSGEDVTVTQDDQSTTYQYKGSKFVVNGEEAQGEAWWYEPGDTWREADHYNYVYDESKGIDRFYNEDGQNVFNLSATNQSKVEQFVKAKAKDFVSTMVAQPDLPRLHEQGVAETKADPTGSWVVYGGSKVMKFKTHGGAKAYAEKNGGKVASSEFYADKIQGVKEAETDYSKRRQRERDVDAGKPVARQRQSKMTDYQKKRAQDKKDMELGETKSLAKRVKVVAGDHAGKTGTVRQIKTGAFKGAPKTYYIDLDDGGQADNLPGKALRLVRDTAVEAVEPTPTGLRHRAEPGVYGGADRDEDPLRTLDKSGTNKIEKSLGIKFDREKKYQGGVDLGDEELDEVNKDTLGRYVKLAGIDTANRASSSSYKSGAAGDAYNKADPSRQEQNRERGIDRAITRLTK